MQSLLVLSCPLHDAVSHLGAITQQFKRPKLLLVTTNTLIVQPCLEPSIQNPDDVILWAQTPGQFRAASPSHSPACLPLLLLTTKIVPPTGTSF